MSTDLSAVDSPALIGQINVAGFWPGPQTLPHICLNADWPPRGAPARRLLWNPSTDQRREIKERWEISSVLPGHLAPGDTVLFLIRTTSQNPPRPHWCPSLIILATQTGLDFHLYSARDWAFLTTGALLNSHESDLWKVLSGYKLSCVSSAWFSPTFLWPALSIARQAAHQRTASF